MSNEQAKPTEQKKPTETEIIRGQCLEALEACAELFDRWVNNDKVLKIRQALEMIQVANERRDKSRILPAVQVTVKDLTPEVCRSLLEIGFDLGNRETVNAAMCGNVEGLTNPFRRASTTITEECLRCGHSLAADGRCHSIGCKCECVTKDKYPERATKCTCDWGPMSSINPINDNCPVHNVPYFPPAGRPQPT